MNYRTVLGRSVVMVALVGAAFFMFRWARDGAEAHATQVSRPRGSTDPADLTSRLQELEELLKQLQTEKGRLQTDILWQATTNPPVGTVLAHVGQWPPLKQNGDAMTEEETWEFGWVECKGQNYDKEQYQELFRAFGSEQLPDFRGRVGRGCSEGEVVRATGGWNVVPAGSTGSAGNHAHNLPAWTGYIGINPPDQPRDKKYSIEDDHAGWRANQGNDPHHIEVGGGGNAEGQHRHELGGNTATGGEHTHSIPSIDIVPSYVAVKFIIKVASDRRTGRRVGDAEEGRPARRP